MLKYLIFLAIVPFISAQQFNPIPGLEQCGGPATLNGAWINAECNSEICTIDPFNAYDIRIDFTAARNHSELTLIVRAIIPGNPPVPIHEQTFDGPFDSGQQYRIEFGVAVTDIYAGLRITIEALLPGEFCATVPIQVADAKLNSKIQKI